MTRPGKPYLNLITVRLSRVGHVLDLQTNKAIVEVLNDALDHKYFFIRGVEVDYRYVMTSQVKDLMDMIASGDLRRSEVAP